MKQKHKKQLTRTLLIFLSFMGSTACVKQPKVLSPVQDMNSGDEIANQTAEDAILPAMELYSYFVLFPFILDHDQPSPDGKRFRVKDESINSFDKLRQLLLQTFSKDITDKLLRNGMYEDYGGYLYAASEGRMKDNSIKQIIYQTLELTDTKITYEVSLTYWNQQEDKPKTLYFIREYIEGKWVFTAFPYFW